MLVAAGESRRMGRDKLWIDIYGRPVWRWSLDALLSAADLAAVVVVTPPGAEARFEDSLPAALAHAQTRVLFADGGATRADSVLAGLDALTRAGLADDTLVLVHDAARPAASADLIRRVIEGAHGPAGTPGAVVPAVPVHDSLRRVMSEDGESVVVETVDRGALVATQTPQLAPLGLLRDALGAGGALGMEVTDEAGALAASRHPVRVVSGDPGNHKLTDAPDEQLVRAVLRARMSPVAPPLEIARDHRAGIGFDAHRLVEGRPLRLGGVSFPDEARGLEGHSDGDAALHAVIDALLGAAGLGDIGQWFPSDDRWRDAPSSELLASAVERVRGAGCEPVSIDLAIVAARPAIAPRRGEMETTIAGIAGIDAAAVSVRATTSDGLGFTGDEGIAAHSVAVVRGARRAT